MKKIIIATVATLGFVGVAAAETPLYITKSLPNPGDQMVGHIDRLATGSTDRRADRRDAGSIGRRVQPGQFWADPDAGYNYYGR